VGFRNVRRFFTMQILILDSRVATDPTAVIKAITTAGCEVVGYHLFTTLPSHGVNRPPPPPCDVVLVLGSPGGRAVDRTHGWFAVFRDRHVPVLETDEKGFKQLLQVLIRHAVAHATAFAARTVSMNQRLFAPR
jgi:hypothetical protein